MSANIDNPNALALPSYGNPNRILQPSNLPTFPNQANLFHYKNHQLSQQQALEMFDSFAETKKQLLLNRLDDDSLGCNVNLHSTSLPSSSLLSSSILTMQSNCPATTEKPEKQLETPKAAVAASSSSSSIAFIPMQSPPSKHKVVDDEKGETEAGERQSLMLDVPSVSVAFKSSPTSVAAADKQNNLNNSNNSTTLPFILLPTSTSQLHSFIKYLSGRFVKKGKRKKVEESLQKQKLKIKEKSENLSKTDKLEKIMKKVTLYTAISILCLLLFVIATRITALNDAETKRLLLQQQVVAPSGRLDLSQFKHLKQVKSNSESERLEEALTKSNRNPNQSKRLLTAGSIPMVEKFRAGLDSRIIPTDQSNHDSREVEWEAREATESARRFYAPAAAVPKVPKHHRTGGQPEAVPKVVPKLGDDCTRCVKENYLAHYYQKDCKPVFSRECNCAKFFRCPRKPTSKKEAPETVKFGDKGQEDTPTKPCTLGSHTYNYNERIPMPSEPCRLCRCRRRNYYNGTTTKTVGEVDCSPFVECPEMVFGVRPKRPTCHFAYKHDQCCGTEVCIDELPLDDIKVKTTCRYRSKVYRYGEVINPEENTCMKCICDETWNPHDPIASKSCIQRQCTSFLKEEIIQKCTPIYRSDGCCPIDFICPDKRQLYDQENQKEAEAYSPDFIPEKCTLNGKLYEIGKSQFIDRTETHHGRVCARCTCKVPPMFTCQADFRCNGQV